MHVRTKISNFGACKSCKILQPSLGVVVDACKREERPSVFLPIAKLYHSEYDKDHLGGASGVPLAHGEVLWPSTEVLVRGAWPLRGQGLQQ